MLICYQTAVLVLSGICLCCVLFGGLIRPLEEVVVPDTRQDKNVICSGVPLKCAPQMSFLCTSNQPSYSLDLFAGLITL